MPATYRLQLPRLIIAYVILSSTATIIDAIDYGAHSVLICLPVWSISSLSLTLQRVRKSIKKFSSDLAISMHIQGKRLNCRALSPSNRMPLSPGAGTIFVPWEKRNCCDTKRPIMVWLVSISMLLIPDFAWRSTNVSVRMTCCRRGNNKTRRSLDHFFQWKSLPEIPFC